MSLEVVAHDLMGSLIGGPEFLVVRDDEAVNVVWLPTSTSPEIPLVEVVAILVKDLNTAVIAIVDENPPGCRVNGDTVDVVPVTGARLLARSRDPSHPTAQGCCRPCRI